MTEIVEVDYGIASNYGDVIEINRKLRKFPRLRNKILEHEKRHSSGTYDKKDFINDFQSEDSTFFESIKFCLVNKEAIVNFFPLMYSYYFKEWTWNSSSFFPFGVLGIIYVLFFKFALNLPILYSILGWIAAVLILNGIFLLITHLYVKTVEINWKKKLD